MKPDFSILSKHQSGELTIFEVDTSKATYQGMAWRTLGDFGKRKFENALVLQNAQTRSKIIYI